MANPHAPGQALLELFDHWRGAWLSLDVDDMLAAFDETFDGLIYLAEEAGMAAVGEPALRTYWERTTKTVLSAVTKWTPIGEVQVVVIDDRTALIFSRLDTRLHIRGIQRPLDGPLRISLLVRRRPSDDRWKIIHYHESRQILPQTNAGPDYIFAADIRMKAEKELGDGE